MNKLQHFVQIVIINLKYDSQHIKRFTCIVLASFNIAQMLGFSSKHSTASQSCYQNCRLLLNSISAFSSKTKTTYERFVFPPNQLMVFGQMGNTVPPIFLKQQQCICTKIISSVVLQPLHFYVPVTQSTHLIFTSFLSCTLASMNTQAWQVS